MWACLLITKFKKMFNLLLFHFYKKKNHLQDSFPLWEEKEAKQGLPSSHRGSGGSLGQRETSHACPWLYLLPNCCLQLCVLLCTLQGGRNRWWIHYQNHPPISQIVHTQSPEEGRKQIRSILTQKGLQGRDLRRFEKVFFALFSSHKLRSGTGIGLPDIIQDNQLHLNFR